MSAPEVWVHRGTGTRYELLNARPVPTRPDLALMRRLPTAFNRHPGVFLYPHWIVACYFTRETPAPAERVGGSDELMALAEAVGVVADQVRKPGQPHESEFAAGPEGHGPAWADDKLWDDFDKVERLGGGR